MGLGSHISYGTLESANALENKHASAVSRMSLSPSSWGGEQKKATSARSANSSHVLHL